VSEIVKFNYLCPLQLNRPANIIITHLHGVVAYVDFLGSVGIPIAWSICDAVAEELAQYGIRRRGLPGDIDRGGGRVVGRCWNGFARGSCKRLSRLRND